MKSTFFLVIFSLYLINFANCQIASPIDCTYPNGIPFHESHFKKVISINSESVIYGISGDNKVICYDIINRKIINHIEIQGYIHDICLFDKAFLITYSSSNESFVSVLDTSLRIIENIYNSNELVFKVISNSNYTEAAILDALNNVVVIDLKSLLVKRKFGYRNHSIANIFYSFNNLYYSNDNGSIGLLDIEKGEDTKLFNDTRLTSCMLLEAIGDTIIFGNDKNIYVLTNNIVGDSIFKVPVGILDMVLNPLDTVLCVFLKNGLVASCKLNEKIDLQLQEPKNILISDTIGRGFTSTISIAELDNGDQHSISFKDISTCVANYGRHKLILGTTSGELILCNARLELIERATYVKSPITQIEINRKGSILYASNADRNLFSLFLPKLTFGEFIVYNNFSLPFKFKDNTSLVGVSTNYTGTDTVYNVNEHRVFRKSVFRRFNVEKDNSIYSSLSRIAEIQTTKHKIAFSKNERVCFIATSDGEVSCDTTQFVKKFAYDCKGAIYTLSGVDTLVLKVNGESIFKLDYISSNLWSKIILKVDDYGHKVGIYYGNELMVIDVKTRQVIWKKSNDQEFVYDFDFLGNNKIVFSFGNFDINELIPESVVGAPVYSKTPSGSIVHTTNPKYYFTITNSGELCRYYIN